MARSSKAVAQMTPAGWFARVLQGAVGSPYRYRRTVHPTLGAEVFGFQHPQRDPRFQVQGPGILYPFHFRVFAPQKWSIQTVLQAGIPATIGTFDLDELTDINGRPYE